MGTFKKHWFIIFILALSCFSAYSNSLHNDFLIDDHDLIFYDTRLHNLHNLWSYFSFEQPDNPTSSARLLYYRPLAHILPMICYHFFEDSPFGYHVVNLILFYFVCLCIYFLLIVLGCSRPLAAVSALLFSVHPINGMLVNYITANVLSLQMILLIVSMMLFIQSHSGKRLSWKYPLSIGLFIISIFCHETSLIFPAYLAVYLMFFKKESWKAALRLTWPFVIIAALYFILRLQYASLKTNLLDNVPLFTLTPVSYLASVTKLLGWYLTRLLFLQDIVFIWVTRPVVNVGPWIIVLVIGSGAALYTILRWKEKVWERFFLIWFLLGFLLVGAGCFIHPKIGLMIEPHWLYFSSIGFFFLFAALLLKIIDSPQRAIGMIVLSLFLFWNASVSRANNRLWADEVAYCRHWLAQVPGFKSVMFYLAAAYDREDYPQARRLYQEALDNDFFDYQVFANLGLMDYKDNQLDSAMRNYEQALKILDSGLVRNNIGLIFKDRGDFSQAERYFNQALEREPFLLEPRLNLAEIYGSQGKIAEAKALYQQNLSLDSRHFASLFHLMRIHLESHQNKEALFLGKRILSQNKKPQYLVEAGSLFALHQYTNLAMALFNKALRLDPFYKEAYLEMGKLYGNKDQFTRAIVIWQDGWKLYPDDERFKKLIEQAQRLSQSKN